MKPKSPIPAQVKRIRTDITEWLWHFVRHESAIETLTKILTTRRLLGSVDDATQITVISFTESPVFEFVRQSALLASIGYKRLSGYGIGFRKSWLFEHGGLPVIYQPRKFLQGLPAESRFRHVDYDLQTGMDYSWQREWRLPANELQFTPRDVVAIVPSFADGDGLLYDVEADGDYIDGEEASFPSLISKWSFVTHDQFQKITDITDSAVEFSMREYLDSNDI